MKKNNTKTLVDISILTAGRVDLFEKCVDAILPQMKSEYKISVCNNGFPSAEYEKVYTKLPEGSVIKRVNTNGGFGFGANTAIKAGNAPLILFVSDDIFLHAGAIEKLIATMDDPTIGQCGLKLLFPPDSQDLGRPAGKVQHIGIATSIRGEMTHPLIGWSPENPKCNISREVPAVTGAVFMMRRGLFNKIGGFNPIYGKGYYEDMELSFSVRSLGSRVWVNTEAVATHGVGQTFKSDSKPIPIQQNQMTFNSRWAGGMAWTEFEVY